MSRRSWTDEALRCALTNAFCWSDVCRGLGLIPTGSNFKTVKKYTKRLGFSFEHFDYTKAYAGRKNSPAHYHLDEILIQNSPYVGTSGLKKRLVKEGLLSYECSTPRCRINDWFGQPLVLQLDHINGVSDDNRLENLRLLCPNCHSTTPTFAGRNIPKRPANHCSDCNVPIQRRSKQCQKCYMLSRETSNPAHSPYLCLDCGSKISRKASRCKSCVGFAQKSKIPWPPLEELLQMVQKTSYLAVGRQLGVSDNAVRKHLRKRGAALP